MGTAPEVVDIVTPRHYRQKVHFVVATDRSGRTVMGHFARLSRDVVSVRECPVHDARGNAVAFGLRDACLRAGTRAVKSIVVRAGCSTQETMATLVVDGVSFLISPTSFFQTNVGVAELLVQTVIAEVPAGARVLDLYAGAGLFAIPLAKRGHEVVAVEDNAAAVADGKASLRLSRVAEERCRYLATTTAAVFGAIRPATAVYVSCDPESLARDLARIAARGYAIASIQPVDMFPHTPHIETVVVVRKV